MIWGHVVSRGAGVAAASRWRLGALVAAGLGCFSTDQASTVKEQLAHFGDHAVDAKELEVVRAVLRAVLPCWVWPRTLCGSECVACRRGHVTHIEITTPRLEGIVVFPDECRGSIPKEVGLLTALISLELNGLPLSGTLPDELGSMSALTTLAIYHCSVSGTLPASFGQLRSLKYLKLGFLSLTGTLPPSFANLSLLRVLDLPHNKLSGTIPDFLARLPLQKLNLAFNQFRGTIPFINVEKISFDSNMFTGTIPAITKKCEVVTFAAAQNFLTGTLPSSLIGCKRAKAIKVDHNNLSGTIPAPASPCDLQLFSACDNSLSGTLPPGLLSARRLKYLRIQRNSLTGTLSGTADLPLLKDMVLSRNQLSGRIPRRILCFQDAILIDLSKNKLSGRLPTEHECPEVRSALRSLDLSENFLYGPVPSGWWRFPDLTMLRMSGNYLSGTLPNDLCSATNLTLLSLERNGLITGPVPPCFVELDSLQVLSLHVNRLTGNLPPGLFQMRSLSGATLHENRFSGRLPDIGLQDGHLSVLTLHHNQISGFLPSIRMEPICVDAPFPVISKPGGGFLYCWQVSKDLEWSGAYNVSKVDGCRRLSKEMSMDLNKACPRTCDFCRGAGLAQTAKVTLHGNRLSCALPDWITNAPSQVTVVLGNMVGSGTEALPSYVMEYERQPFLFYSGVHHKNMVLYFIAGVPVPFCLMCCVRYRLYASSLESVQQISPAEGADNAEFISWHRLVTQHLLLLCIVGNVCILPAYRAGARYFDCGKPLSHFTAAYFHGLPSAEYFVATMWCSMSFVSAILIERGPKEAHCVPKAHREHTYVLARFLGWLSWMCVAVIYSVPQIIFALTETVPNSHRTGVNVVHWRSFALLASIFVDCVLTESMSTKFAELFKTHQDALAGLLRVYSWCFVPTLCMVTLHENCRGRWKWFWDVCGDRSTAFDWEVPEFGLTILNSADICAVRRHWWSQGKCSRAIIEALTSLLMAKLAVRSLMAGLPFLGKWLLRAVVERLLSTLRTLARRVDVGADVYVISDEVAVRKALASLSQQREYNHVKPVLGRVCMVRDTLAAGSDVARVEHPLNGNAVYVPISLLQPASASSKVLDTALRWSGSATLSRDRALGNLTLVYIVALAWGLLIPTLLVFATVASFVQLAYVDSCLRQLDMRLTTSGTVPCQVPHYVLRVSFLFGLCFRSWFALETGMAWNTIVMGTSAAIATLSVSQPLVKSSVWRGEVVSRRPPGPTIIELARQPD